MVLNHRTCQAGKPSATAQEVWLIYAWTQVDICYPTFTMQYLPRKIPSSDYFWILFLRRQNNLLDNSHCYLFLHRPSPWKPQEDSEFAPKALRSLLVAFYHKLTISNSPFSSDPCLTTAPEAECLFPGQDMPNHLGAAIPAVLPRMLHLWLALCSLCSPAQQRAQRAGQVSVLPSCILAPPWERGVGTGSQKEHNSGGMAACSVALEQDVAHSVLLLG